MIELSLWRKNSMSTATEAPPKSRLRTLDPILHALGGIDASRVRMRPVPGTAKVKDAIRINESKEGGFVELVDGVLVEKAMGFPEAFLAIALSTFLKNFVDPANLGIVLGADGMMQLFPGLLRMPDVSYFSWERLGGSVPTKAAPVIAPNLAVEVLSAGNTKKEMTRKRKEYFESGVNAVWMVDPKTRTVAVYSNPDEWVVLTENDVISGGTVLPDFSLEVRKLFGELDRTQG